MTQEKVTRRSYLKYVGAGAVVLAAAAGGAYYLSRPSGPTATTTTAVPTSGPALPPSQDPLYMYKWPYGQELVTEYVSTFEKEYNDVVKLTSLPGDYYAAISTMFIGKTPIDLAYSGPSDMQKWYYAGWIRPLDDMPDIDKIKAESYPVTVENSTAADGSLLGLTYYIDANILWRNEKILKAAGYGDAMPETWDEVFDICVECKKQGLSDYPYLAKWYKSWYAITWQFYQDCYAEGEYLFDKNFDPTFDTNTPIMKVLETYKKFYDAGLVTPAALTFSEAENHAAWTSGAHVFKGELSLFLFYYQDPSASPIAPNCGINRVYPGKTHDQALIQQNYTLSSQDRTTKHIDRAYNLLKFFGWKDKSGAYYIPTQWMLKSTLWQAFPAVNDSEEVKAVVHKWAYRPEEYDWIKKALSESKPITAWRALWTREWETKLIDDVQAGILGQMKLDEVVNDLRDYAVQLKKQYAGAG